jgi:hypothetical protein
LGATNTKCEHARNLAKITAALIDVLATYELPNKQTYTSRNGCKE